MGDVVTTVQGEEEKIEALKKLGHGSITRAFKIGMDIMLGIANDDIQKLKLQKKEYEQERETLINRLQTVKTELENEITGLDVKIDQIAKKINKLIPDTDINNVDYLEVLVNEFFRCSTEIIFRHNRQLIKHLSGLNGSPDRDKIIEFYENRRIEPTREEIAEFLTKAIT